MPQRAYIAIGSNLGDRKANFLEAVERIGKLPGTRVIKQSSLYESEPLSDDVNWYLNAVVEIETEYSVADLLKKLLAIEAAMGRKRIKGKRWGSRIIDLDIAFFNNEIVDKRNLKVPHPEAHNRKFVLAPMSELAPQFMHPRLAKTISELLASLRYPKKVHLFRST